MKLELSKQSCKVKVDSSNESKIDLKEIMVKRKKFRIRN